jgi:hypothetical protein
MAMIFTFLRRWGLALIIMAAIFGFSSVPSTEMPDFGLADLLVKKGGHALGFGLLALSYLRGLNGGDGSRTGLHWYLIAWIMATLYSAMDELHQSIVPGRYPAVADVLVDAFGAAVALMLANRYYKQVRPFVPTNH